MSRVVELLCSRRVPHVAVLALISIGFAGCSADMSTRLSQAQNPFSNPYEAQPEATGAVPAPAVERRELPQYARPQSQSRALPPQVAPRQSYPTANGGVSGGGRGLASYAPPGQPIETTGTVPPRSVVATRAPGGTTIIVGTSDTLDILAPRYHVTPAAILQANGYKGPRALSPGQQLIIPHPAAAVAAAPALAAPASKPVAVAAVPSAHVVNHGDTLLSIARRNHVSVAELAKANNIDPQAKLKLGMKLTVPAGKTAAVAPAAPVVVAAAQPAAALAPPATKLAAAAPAGPQQTARLAQATTKIEDTPAEGPVKAAEDGVVAYSGNELKGYGNLVLVRHSNGYVTAYAHASELLVKRGDTIKRGQIIAKSGQSGEVGSPQLHFEIRKGSSPVDPLQFLNGA